MDGVVPRILIVDDDRLMRVMLSDILQTRSYRTREAATGQAALELVRQDPPELVLLDKVLPDIDGLELIPLLRNVNQGNAPYVVMITSSHVDRDLVAALERGANDYIHKPFSPEVVLARVGAVLEARVAHQRLALSKERYQLAAAAGCCGLWDWNIREDYVYSTQSLQDLLGVRNPPTRWDDWLSLVHEEDRQALREAVLEYVAGGHEALEVEVRIPTARCPDQWFLCRGRLTRDYDLAPVRLLGVFADITARKHAELALKCSLQSLAEAQSRLEEQTRQLEQANQTLEAASRVDPLTGVGNRRSLQERLASEFARCQRYGHPLACVIADIDNFKRINDTHGHAAGDAVLVLVAQRLREELRAADFLSRLGGEEFCVLLPDTDDAGGECWAERARAALADAPLVVDGTPMRVTISLGVATWQRTHQRPDQLLDDADQLLLVAKRTGKNRVMTSGVLNANPRYTLLGCNADVRTTLGTLMRPCTYLPRGDEPVMDVVDALVQHGLASCPVVDEKGVLLGVISEKDLIGLPLCLEGWRRPLREFVAGNPIVFPPEATAADAIRFLQRAPIRMVVIVHGDRPIGTITRSDLLAWARRQLVARACRVGGEGETMTPVAAGAG